jgi:hypothetical protein
MWHIVQFIVGWNNFGGYRQERQVKNLVPKKKKHCKETLLFEAIVEYCMLPEAERKKATWSALFFKAKNSSFWFLGNSYRVEIVSEEVHFINKNSEIICLLVVVGHKVLFTIPYYSNLWPIELLWVYIKGTISEQCRTNKTQQIVSRELTIAFGELEEYYKATIQYWYNTTNSLQVANYSIWRVRGRAQSNSTVLIPHYKLFTND